MQRYIITLFYISLIKQDTSLYRKIDFLSTPHLFSVPMPITARLSREAATPDNF